ncbi:endonuclease VII domain-containing protein [Nonomuraea sp. NPDC004580]|uniref:endonuclease VII domain-containing protein n=1 Tax=Nonomuraea sp. NPDC004580 TaxID=3154552 RepID=UPI0033BEA878
MNEITKKCTRCSEDKPLAAYGKNPKGIHGRQSRCNPCLAIVARERRGGAQGKDLDTHLQRTFGITLEQYTEMLQAQNGACAICGDIPIPLDEYRIRKQGISTRLAVDHCHETGRVRGLLCSPCNKGIGQLRDSPALVRKALAYLRGAT